MRGFVRVLLVGVTLLIALPAPVGAASFANDRFRALWASGDEAVARGEVQRAWLWGPEPITPGRNEPYAEGAGGQRLVQYFDKGRMELAADGRTVTSGLLTLQLATGRLQTGDARFEQRSPAAVPIAGDPDTATSPTYADFGALVGRPARAQDALVTEVVSPGASLATDAGLETELIRNGELASATGHRVANVFLAYFTGQPFVGSGGLATETAPFSPWVATTGWPVSEAYWTRVPVGGTPRLVLVQLFERRVLTYTPSNPAGSRVEMGNAGRHFLTWLEQSAPPAAPPSGAADERCPAALQPVKPGPGKAPYTTIQTALHYVGDKRFVSGTVRNEGPNSEAIEILVSRFSKDGRRYGVSRGYTDLDFWPTGQLAGFRIQLPDNEPLAYWTVAFNHVLGVPSGGLRGDFRLENLGGEIDGLGIANVTGVLRYTGSERHLGVVIVRIHLLDGCGNLITTALTSISGAAQPGASKTFTTIVPRADGASQIRALIEAREGSTSFVADDALKVYRGGLDVRLPMPITGTDGSIHYRREYTRSDGIVVWSLYRLLS